jgi:hypothetical protein
LRSFFPNRVFDVVVAFGVVVVVVAFAVVIVFFFFLLLTFPK